jgi:hypothetical protein
MGRMGSQDIDNFFLWLGLKLRFRLSFRLGFWLVLRH